MTTPLQAFRAEEARYEVRIGPHDKGGYSTGWSSVGVPWANIPTRTIINGTKDQCQDWITERALEAAFKVRLREVAKDHEQKAIQAAKAYWKSLDGGKIVPLGMLDGVVSAALLSLAEEQDG